MSDSNLPYLPEPAPGESFSSWFARTTGLYFGNARQMMRWLNTGPVADADDPPAQLLRRMEALEPGWRARFRTMTLYSRPRESKFCRQSRYTIAPTRLGPYLMYDQKRRFCPLCLCQPEPIWPLSWRIGAPVCFQHGVWLERRCAVCATDIKDRGAEPLSHCRCCSTPWAATPAEAAPQETLRFLESVDKRIALMTCRGAPTKTNDLIYELEYAEDWWELGRLANRMRKYSEPPPESLTPEQRPAFIEFVTASVKANLTLIDDLAMLLPPKPEPQPKPKPWWLDPNQPTPKPSNPPKLQPKPKPPLIPRPESLFADLSKRVDAAVALAKKELLAEGAELTPKTWRRRADQILRRQEPPANDNGRGQSPVNALAGKK